MFSADLGGAAPASAPSTNDPPFQKVALLLHGDGTNGAQNNTFVDSSSNNFTITRTGNVAQGTFSPFSLAEGQWSNYFDGNGDKLTASGDFRLTGDFNISFWYYPTNTNYAGISIGNETTARILFYVYGNSNIIYDIYAAGSGNFGGIVPLNAWSFITISRSGSSVTAYINGNSTGTLTISGTLGNSNNLYIWGDSGGAHSQVGYLSNLRIISGSTGSATVPTTPLTAISGTSLLTCQSNRFKDNSSNNFTITPYGDTKVTAFSPFAPPAAYSASTNGGSAYFDGSGDYLQYANTAWGTSDFTIEFFVFMANAGGTQVFADFRNYGGTPSGNAPVIYLTGGTLYGEWGGTGPSLSAGTWHHIATTRSGTTISMYLNGVRVATFTDSRSYGAFPSMFGNQASGTPYTGYMSNIRVLVGTALYTGSTYTVPTAPLTAITNTQLLLNCVNAGIIDNSGKNDIETVGNAQISTSVKKYGTGSMYFDGTGDYLRIPNSSLFNFGSENFTVEFWINPISLPSETLPFALVDGGFSYPFTAYLVFGQVKLLYNGLNTINTSATLTTNTWAHLAYVKNNGIITIYVNGISVGSASVSSINPTTNPIGIGGRGDDGRFPFNGYIDDLRITKGQALYTSNFTPPTQAFPNV